MNTFYRRAGEAFMKFGYATLYAMGANIDNILENIVFCK
jgi:hypothetical protein